jgi:hypothetical protein
MSEEKNPQQGDRGRILPFTARNRRSAHRAFSGWNAGPAPSPINDIGKYERPGADPDDYRHRMTMNAAAFAFCIVLVVIGSWLAIKIAEFRRDQDCVLSGRRNCAQISIIGNRLGSPN